jgi:hypothetical protein
MHLTQALLVCCSLPFSISAQQFGSQVISVTPPQTLTAKRGTTVSETLTISVASGFHVNSDKPRDDFLIPLKLTWKTGPLQPKAIRYPHAEQVKVGSDTLNVFTGKFPVTTEFFVSPEATPGISMLEGKLRYQACDNVSCKRPATLNVQVPVSIQ